MNKRECLNLKTALSSVLLMLAPTTFAEQYFNGKRLNANPSGDVVIEYLAFRIGNKVSPSFSIEARGNMARTEDLYNMLENDGFVVGLYSKWLAQTEHDSDPYLIMGYDYNQNLDAKDSWWYHGDIEKRNAFNIGAGVEYGLSSKMRLVGELMHQDSTSSNTLTIGFDFEY